MFIVNVSRHIYDAVSSGCVDKFLEFCSDALKRGLGPNSPRHSNIVPIVFCLSFVSFRQNKDINIRVGGERGWRSKGLTRAWESDEGTTS